jgi:hypothetical protein
MGLTRAALRLWQNRTADAQTAVGLEIRAASVSHSSSSSSSSSSFHTSLPSSPPRLHSPLLPIVITSLHAASAVSIAQDAVEKVPVEGGGGRWETFRCPKASRDSGTAPSRAALASPPLRTHPPCGRPFTPPSSSNLFQTQQRSNAEKQLITRTPARSSSASASSSSASSLASSSPVGQHHPLLISTTKLMSCPQHCNHSVQSCSSRSVDHLLEHIDITPNP